MAVKKWRDVGARLWRMDRAEGVDRWRQGMAKRSDALRGWLGHDFNKTSRRSSSTRSANFFFAAQSVDAILLRLEQRLPGRAKQIVEEADRICRHQFDLLGYQSLNYNQANDGGIDWHWDAVHQKRSPKKAFHRIQYLSYQQCGDSKVIWELNRHQHLVTLGKAYRLTHDARYADETLRQWRHWQAENPYPIGINWASSLEVAIRSLAWLWTYHLFEGGTHLCDFRDEWLRGLALHGRHIERYLSTYFSPNTHLLGEGVGLFFLGVLCPELARANQWKTLGWEIILQESERQVPSDGFHFEQSTYYHVFALDLFLHAVVLAYLNDVAVPESLGKKIEQMCSALHLLCRFGPPPSFGDDDGGRLFDGQRNRTEHLTDPLSTGAILFHRGDYKGVGGGLTEEALWLLGEEGVREWDRLENIPPRSESAALANAGYYMPACEESQMIVDCGPMGVHSAGHGHADALSICLQSRGQSLLVDCGTFEYVGPADDRNAFRGTGMHNTVSVDGLSQTIPRRAFSWEKLTHTKLERWIRGQNFDLLLASHDGYRRLPQPVAHRRWVISFKNGMYLVRDVLEGTGKHRIVIAWHLAPGLELAGDGVFRTHDFRTGMFFLSAPDSGWRNEVREQQYSPAYGQKAPIKVLHFTNDHLILPAEFAVVLKATTDAQRMASSLGCFQETDRNVSRYEYREGDQLYSFIFNESGKQYDCGTLVSDAEFVSHRRGARGKEEQVMMCQGSYVRIDRGPELRSIRSVEWAELGIEDGDRRMSSSDPSALVDGGLVPLATAGIRGQV